MKKVGIVTIIDYANYGNRLQNYALSYFLRNNYDCKAVTLEGYNSAPPYSSRLFTWCKVKVAQFLCYYFPLLAEKLVNTKMIRWARFERWSKRNIPMARFYNCDHLPCSLDNDYDLFFAGSDQIWNYNFSGNRFNDFFLLFVNQMKRVSISASFGVDFIPKEKREYYVNGLSRFSSISVREKAGMKIIKDLIGKDVPVLIDPVMMLDKEEWIKVEVTPKIDLSKPYILKYFLGRNEEQIDKWAKENGYVIYELLNERSRDLYTLGPGEFIALVRNASMVCSDSFHCIAFSILFKIPFVVYERKGKEDSMISRLDTLLSTFGFQDRWYNSLEEKDYLNCDFEHISPILISEKKKFSNYISAVINDEKTI